MNKATSTLALTFTLLLSVSLLSACGGSGGGDEPAAGTSDTTDTTGTTGTTGTTDVGKAEWGKVSWGGGSVYQ